MFTSASCEMVCNLFSGLVYQKGLKGHQFLLCQTREHRNKQTALKTWERKCSTCCATLVLISLMIPFYSQKWCALEKHLWKRLVTKQLIEPGEKSSCLSYQMVLEPFYVYIKIRLKKKIGESYFNSWSILWSMNINQHFLNSLNSGFVTRNM